MHNAEPGRVCIQTPRDNRAQGPETRVNFSFFFFLLETELGVGEGGQVVAVSCFQRSSHLAAGTATCPLAQHFI